ncbi:MAG: type II toxin-antitoxin system VapC family toxin [Candidatus Saccharimonas sp.]|nr:type II toxin-antitoxin system VapC family toxin [Planctomycetaceae bacterium]
MSPLFVFDTDCFTPFQFNHPAVVSRAALADRLTISIVTVEESLTGWYSRVRQTKTSEQLAVVYHGFHKTVGAIGVMEILPYSQTAIERQLELRRQFRRMGKMDLAIASIALEFGATLVTRNRIDFEQISGLNIEDWSVPHSGGEQT